MMDDSFEDANGDLLATEEYIEGRRFDIGLVELVGKELRLPPSLPPEETDEVLRRHACGDWGEVSEAVRAANERSLAAGRPVLSVHFSAAGRLFSICTQPEQGITTLTLL